MEFSKSPVQLTSAEKSIVATQQLLSSAQDMTILSLLRLMEEILHHMGYINLVNNGRNYQPQLLLAGFLNHQQ